MHRRPLLLVLLVVGLVALVRPAQAAEQAATGTVQVPALRWKTASEVEAAWRRVRAMVDASAQFAAVDAVGLQQMACRDTVDLRALEASHGTGFGWRDGFRGRSWLRPTLARVLLRAHAALRQERPDVHLALGDLGQPGCGQISQGTLVRLVEDAAPGDGEATRLLRAARLELGRPMVVETRTSADFLHEGGRFHRRDIPVRVEHALLGQGRTDDGRLVLRVATRRYAPAPLPERPRAQKRLIAKMLRAAKQAIRSGDRVLRAQAVTSWSAGGHALAAQGSVTVEHRIDRRRKRNVLVLGKNLATASEIRLSRWHPRKPGSLSGEERWQPTRGDDGKTVWTRWRLLSEAGHLSHDAARDADVSYASLDDDWHFRKGIQKIDAAATWRWLELLEATALQAGTPVERVLVDKRVRRYLARHLPREARKTTTWQLLTVSKGHDAHHHIRLGSASAAVEAVAQAELATPGAILAAVRQVTPSGTASAVGVEAGVPARGLE